MENSLHVLFIEDSETDAQIVLQALQGNGYPLDFQRVNSATALQLALKRQWDVIICEEQLHDFSALEALQILEGSSLYLPFIVITDFVQENIAAELIRAGASDYLFKRHLKHLVAAIDRKFQEAEICRIKQQSEAAAFQLAAIVESSEDAIISTDPHGHVLTWNLGAEKLYGYSVEEAKGELLARLIQPYENNLLILPLEQEFDRIIDCRQVVQRRKTGELIDILFTVSLIRTTENQIVGFAIIARDISDHQMIQRMKNEFISIINHELRTPLASLQGSIELLLTGKLGDLSDRGLRMLEIAANNIDRLVQLTGNILDLEELTSGKVTILKQQCDIGELVSQTVSSFQTMALQRGVRLSVASRSIHLCLDRDRIRQVLHHLIMNAIQFSQVGGSIWIEVELHDEGQLKQLQSSCVVIKVKDEGEGIPSDKLETIFDQFQQADTSDTRRQKGAGLGLAICRSIIQQHKGNLWTESILGQGSTFYLALPLQRVKIQTF